MPTHQGADLPLMFLPRYDSGSTDNTLEMLQPWMDAGTVKLHAFAHGKSQVLARQQDAAHALSRHSQIRPVTIRPRGSRPARARTVRRRNGSSKPTWTNSMSPHPTLPASTARNRSCSATSRISPSGESSSIIGSIREPTPLWCPECPSRMLVWKGFRTRRACCACRR